MVPPQLVALFLVFIAANAVAAVVDAITAVAAAVAAVADAVAAAIQQLLLALSLLAGLLVARLLLPALCSSIRLRLGPWLAGAGKRFFHRRLLYPLLAHGLPRQFTDVVHFLNYGYLEEEGESWAEGECWAKGFYYPQ